MNFCLEESLKNRSFLICPNKNYIAFEFLEKMIPETIEQNLKPTDLGQRKAP